MPPLRRFGVIAGLCPLVQLRALLRAEESAKVSAMTGVNARQWSAFKWRTNSLGLALALTTRMEWSELVLYGIANFQRFDGP